MKKFLITCFIAVNILALGACSDKDDPEPGMETKTAKFTITAEGVGENELADFTFVGSTGTQENSIWKVDGNVRTNEPLVDFDAASFPTKKTYVIESNMPIVTCSASISCLNFDNIPIKISYKAEVNGKVVKEESQTISGEGGKYSIQYQY
ncbi:hypothetical protein [Olivibacter domesticus]|uniref:Lipocalin-like domain-containing protein n=1 Tax=Olivibacter domesticus TaxID=407022 RepID=A0A1H7M9M4_OLID1|nr:hypothetical protein [Olivibacter domesticus]SEL07779.1 hypothetical protein SAMN05661044_01914 [Olivibacter domesticus]